MFAVNLLSFLLQCSVYQPALLYNCSARGADFAGDRKDY